MEIRFLAYRLMATLAVGSMCLPEISSAEVVNPPEAPIIIKLGKPTFVLPQFSNPFMEREAGIAPHEYELAERLRALLDAGDKQAALAELSTMFNLELSPAMLHLKAQVYFNLEDYEQAEATFKAVLMRMPQFVRAHSDLGQLYLVTNRPEQARKHFASAIAYGESSPVIYGQLGYLNLTLHNSQSAIAAYQNALAIEPENPQWQQGLLAALSRAKMHPAAVSMTHEMLANDADNADLWLNKAFLHVQQDQHFEALASLETALALGDTAPANRLAAAQLHLQLDSYRRANEILVDYLASQSVDLSLLNQLAAWLEANGRFRELNQLLLAYERGNEVPASERSQYHLLKARTARGLGDYKNAAEHYRAALATDPSNAQALIAAAKFHYLRDDLVEAETLYTRAESFDQTRQDAMLGRARIYIDLKDYRSALEVLRQAQADFPNMPELSRNIAILERAMRNQRSAL